MILLVASNKDPASLNIKEKMLTECPFVETAKLHQESPIYSADLRGKSIQLITLANEEVYAQNLIDSFPNLELVVFLSRHSSQSGKPTLSVHAPGNFNEAGLGGLPRTLSIAPAKAMHDALKALDRLKTEMTLEYEVSYECTHHGPSLNAPSMFVELGSTLNQWHDPLAAQAVAKAAIDTIINFERTNHQAVLGIGGPHYNPKFTSMALEEGTLFGHIVPKYSLSHLNVELLNECIEKTQEKVNQAILDWKGIPSVEKPRIVDLLNEVDLPFTKA